MIPVGNSAIAFRVGICDWIEPESLVSGYYHVRTNLLGKYESEFTMSGQAFLRSVSDTQILSLEKMLHLVEEDGSSDSRRGIIQLKNVNHLVEDDSPG